MTVLCELIDKTQSESYNSLSATEKKQSTIRTAFDRVSSVVRSVCSEVFLFLTRFYFSSKGISSLSTFADLRKVAAFEVACPGRAARSIGS